MEDKNLNIDILGAEVVVAEPVLFDFPSTRDRLVSVLDEYRGIEVTEDNIKTAKAKKSELASIRNRVDEARKAVKREYKKPLELFSDQVNSLKKLIAEVEDPLSEEIKAFDDETRNQHRLYALKVADELAKSEGLTPEFANQIEIKKKFSNLTIKNNEIRADLETQVALLKTKQGEKEATIQALRIAVERENQSLTAKMDAEEFISLMDRVSPAELHTRIRDRGDQIRKTESEAQRPHEPSKDTQAIEGESKTSQTGHSEPEEAGGVIPLDRPEPEDQYIYKVTFVVVGTKAQQEALSGFLKTGRYQYEAVFQQIIG